MWRWSQFVREAEPPRPGEPRPRAAVTKGHTHRWCYRRTAGAARLGGDVEARRRGWGGRGRAMRCELNFSLFVSKNGRANKNKTKKSFRFKVLNSRLAARREPRARWVRPFYSVHRLSLHTHPPHPSPPSHAAQERRGGDCNTNAAQDAENRHRRPGVWLRCRGGEVQAGGGVQLLPFPRQPGELCASSRAIVQQQQHMVASNGISSLFFFFFAAWKHWLWRRKHRKPRHQNGHHQSAHENRAAAGATQIWAQVQNSGRERTEGVERWVENDWELQVMLYLSFTSF